MFNFYVILIIFVAEASNGNLYHFDDAQVRQVSLSSALSSDAYVIIYEMEKESWQMMQLSEKNGIVKNPMAINGKIESSNGIENGNVYKPRILSSPSASVNGIQNPKFLPSPILVKKSQ